MNIVLLSGGSGKRLWPLSNDVRSKQFIKIFKGEDGAYESMVQRVVPPDLVRWIPERSVHDCHVQDAGVRDPQPAGSRTSGVCVEPCRRDTFPAIALATAYLRGRTEACACGGGCGGLPGGSFCGSRIILRRLKRLSDLARTKARPNLALMGIEPTYPSEKYGYIIPAASRCGQPW